MKRTLLLSLLAVLLCSTGSPAALLCGTELLLQQPSPYSNTFTAYNYGDEFLPVTETEDDYTIVQKNGVYYYATLDDNGEFIATDNVVGFHEPPEEPHLRRTGSAREQRITDWEDFNAGMQPRRDEVVTMGVILIQFADWENNESARGGRGDFEGDDEIGIEDLYTTEMYWNKYFSEDTWVDDAHPCYDQNGGNEDDNHWWLYGSLKDYHKEVTYDEDEVTPESCHPSFDEWDPSEPPPDGHPDVEVRGFLNPAVWIGEEEQGTYIFNWYPAENDRDHYNQGGNITDLYNEACDSAREAGFEFENGDYDVIAVVWAGEIGEVREDNRVGLRPQYQQFGNEQDVYFTNEEVHFRDPIPIGGERRARTGLSHIGTDCHEFSHAALGLSDLYVQGEYRPSVGAYCLMSHGSILKDGASPAHLCAWSKLKTGIISNPRVIDQDGVVTLTNIEQNADCLILWKNGHISNEGDWTQGQYFIAEFRRAIGFDGWLCRNQEGLLIMHFDSEGSRGNPAHRYLDIEEADDYPARCWFQLFWENDLYPIEVNADFGTNATPNSYAYGGYPSFVEINDIGFVNDNLMSANISLTVDKPIFHVISIQPDPIGWPEGNNDMSIEQGETASLSLTLTNIGIEAENDITVTVSTEDPHVQVTIINGDNNFTIPGRIGTIEDEEPWEWFTPQPQENNPYIRVQMSNNCPIGHYAIINLSFESQDFENIDDLSLGVLCELPIAPNFPVTFDNEGNPTVFHNLNVANIDNDPEQEITLYSEIDQTVHCISPTQGNDQWSNGTGRYCEKWLSAPAIGDVRNDGFPEVVLILTEDMVGRLLFYNGDAIGENNPYHQSIWFKGSPALGDLDMDGKLDIVVNKSLSVNAYDGEGNRLNGNWPAEMDPSNIISTPAIADMDCDGDLEIIITRTQNGNDNRRYIKILDHEGNQVYESDHSNAIYSPVIGDVDGNGYPDAIIMERNNARSGTGIYRYYWDSEEDEYSTRLIRSLFITYGYLALADLTGDGIPEIIIGTGTYDGKNPILINAFDYEGNFIDGWPVEIPHSAIASLCAQDFDGDGEIDIVAIDSMGTLLAFASDGSNLFNQESPAFASNYQRVYDYQGDVVYRRHGVGPCFAGDLDNDGDVDIVNAGLHHLKMWSTESPYDPRNNEWVSFQCDAKNSGRYHHIVNGENWQPDNVTLLWHDRVRLAGESDIIIPASTTVVIEPGTIVEFPSNWQHSLIIHGTITAAGTESDSIIFRCDDMGGSIICDGQDGQNSRFQYCVFENLITGIGVSELTLNNSIENCRFYHNNTGIDLFLSATDVTGCEFEECLMGVNINDDEATPLHTISASLFENCIFGVYLFNSWAITISGNTFEVFGDEMYGISGTFCNQYNITGNTFHGSTNPTEYGVYMWCSFAGMSFLDINIIQGFNRGVVLYSSNARMTSNQIEKSETHGIQLYNFSTPDMSSNAYNTVCMSGVAEIWSEGQYSPIFSGPIQDNYGHNNIYNLPDCSQAKPYFLCNEIWVVGPINVSGNYLGDPQEVPNPRTRFLDANNDQIPIILNDRDGAPQPDDGGRERDEIQRLFFLALEYEYEGRMVVADSLYRRVIEAAPESRFGSTSMTHLLHVHDRDEDYDDLIEYLQNLADELENRRLVRRALNLAAYSMVMNGDYRQAIRYYERILDDNLPLRDSVYAVIDAGFAYHAAGVDQRRNRRDSVDESEPWRRPDDLAYVPLLGKRKDLKPTSISMLYKKMRELLNLLETSENGNSELIPEEFFVNQNYPNPFNSVTHIRYGLKEGVEVSLKIFDVTGREVKSLVRERQKAGYYSIIWDGTNNSGVSVSSGMYFYKIKAGDFVKSQKLVLVK